MQSTQALAIPTAALPTLVHPPQIGLPDHTQLPESDGTFVKNFQEHPQSIVLTSSIEPVLQKLHPDGRYCIGQDSGIYWHLPEPPEKGAEAPDWFYVPDVSPLVNGEYRRSYVMWQEIVAPLIAIEFVSGNGSEERDASPLPEHDEIDPKTGKKKQAGKLWVYEQAVRIPFYAIFEPKKSAVEVYHLVDGRYEQMLPNDRGHYPIAPMGVELGIQFGTEKTPIPWLRWWDLDGNLLLTGDERAIAEKQARLQAELAQQQAELAQQQAELIANQEKLAKERAEAIATQVGFAQQQAEAIALQERFAKEEAEAIAAQERQEKLQERQEKERLAAYLRSLGINPDDIP